MTESSRREVGAQAETRALAYLNAHGCELVARNFRCRQGEIDLVVNDHGILALVEVRYRRSRSHGGAAPSVGWRKQRRLIHAARYLLASRPELAQIPARFDVMAIDVTESGREAIEWIRDAFRVER